MRPTFVMIEPEPPQALSSRKLVLETAKFNVITAYSGDEGIELIKSFPNATAIIVHGEMREPPCEHLVSEIRTNIRPELPVIVLTARPGFQCQGADHHVSSYEPTELLQLLRNLFGDPR